MMDGGIFRRVGAKYDTLVKLTTMNQDRRWRLKALSMIRGLDSPSILELASGTGLITGELLKLYPSATILAIDSSPSMVAKHRAEIVDARVRVNVMNALDAEPSPDKFDLVISGYLPKYVPLDRLASTIDRVLREGGEAVIFDFSIPSWPARLFWELWIRLLRVLLYIDPDTRDMSTRLWGYIRRNDGWERLLADMLLKAKGKAYRVETVRVSFGACTILHLEPA